MSFQIFFRRYFFQLCAILIPKFVRSQNGQTHFKNLAANAATILKCA